MRPPRSSNGRNHLVASKGDNGRGKGASGGRTPVTGKSGSSSSSTPTAAQQSAYDTMYSTLESYGLGSLSKTLWGFIKDGLTGDSLSLALQQTDAWKQRFAGNEALRQKGIPVLSPAEYISMERSYAQIMRNYGLPAGFYDEPSDFASWIGNNVSANELQQRVTQYADLANREDAATVDQLQSMGMTKGDLLAYMIDPDRAAPIVTQQYQTALLGASARRAGVVSDNDYLSGLASRGVTEDQAASGFAQIGASLSDANRLGLSLQDLESEVFDGDATATKKRKRLASQERGRFSGSSGISSGSLSQSTSGSY